MTDGDTFERIASGVRPPVNTDSRQFGAVTV